MRTDDPSYHLLTDDVTSTPVVHRDGCYICDDREFAQMGLPLCRKCPSCLTRGSVGHIAADDTVCDDCGFDQASEERSNGRMRDRRDPTHPRTHATKDTTR